MAVFNIVCTTIDSTVPGVNPGDTFIITVTTDGRSTLCTIANGGIVSVTGTVYGSSFDITTGGGYPGLPSLNPATGDFTINGPTLTGGLVAGLVWVSGGFVYSVNGEITGIDGTFPMVISCPTNAQGV